MRVWVGTSGYNYPEWRGASTPRISQPIKMLPYYAERFSTVEINYTFYRMPNAKTIAGWDAETPAGFSFALKAPQRITHDARLKDVDEPLRYFLDTASQPRPEAGPACCSSSRPTSRRIWSGWATCSRGSPRGYAASFEFRHDELVLRRRVRASCGRSNAALCVADTEKGTTPLVATADFGYFGCATKAMRRRTSRSGAGPIKDLGKGWRDAFVYFKHEEAGIRPGFRPAAPTLLTIVSR